jgi:GGDEF domain-containing protein
MIFHVFGALAELERELIRERTLADLESARAPGRVGGRPSTMTPAKLKLATRMGLPRGRPGARWQRHHRPPAPARRGRGMNGAGAELVSVSAGVAMLSEAADPEELLNAADIAMYAAKGRTAQPHAGTT